MARTTLRRSHRTSTALTALALGLALVLSACAEDAEPASDPTSAATETPSASESASETPSPSATEPTTSEEPQAQTIDITVEGDTVTPSGERVQVNVGEEVILHITADAPGDIHVHSTPEQELSYEAGTSDLSLTIDQPGLVEVESHTLELVIVQLEVR